MSPADIHLTRDERRLLDAIGRGKVRRTPSGRDLQAAPGASTVGDVPVSTKRLVELGLVAELADAGDYRLTVLGEQRWEAGR